MPDRYFRLRRSRIYDGKQYKGAVGEEIARVATTSANDIQLRFRNGVALWFEYNEVEESTKEEYEKTPQTKISVVVIRDSVIERNFLFIGDSEREVVLRAQEKFAELCKSLIQRYDRANLPAFLEDGYVQFGKNCSICINWPELETPF